jgi:predicted short-subunit dehydrogenase-like oxidoreductase (DUF2520 family)
MVGELEQLGRVGVIGAGAVGWAIARALAARGALIESVTSRTMAHARALAASLPNGTAVASTDAVAAGSDSILVAVPDDAIAQVAQETAWRAGQLAIHLSGAQGADALSGARLQGARVAALHPLMTFPRSAETPDVEAILRRLAGCAWAYECDDEASIAQVTAIVAALDGHAIRLTAADRAPYHLAAVLASNYIVTLLAAAVRLWGTFGARPESALEALLPLTRAAVAHLDAVGLPDALTGPIARGDLGTVRTHLDWLTAHAASTPDLLRLRDAYIALARLTAPVALEKGSLSPAAAEGLLRLLGDAAARPHAPPNALRGGDAL